MRKKATIVIDLVEESTEEPNEQIEKEIIEEISQPSSIIPWLREVEKVTVIEE